MPKRMRHNLYAPGMRKNTPAYRDGYDAIRWYRDEISEPPWYVRLWNRVIAWFR